MNWYTIHDIDQLDTPALVIYPARVKENIRRVLEMVDGDPARLRPHIKTHKSPEATRLLLDAGIRAFKCATIAEAEMLAIEGAPDVLLAYQPLGPKLSRFVSLVKKYPATKFSCLLDDQATGLTMGTVFSTAGLEIPVYIDLDLGMHRTGIAPGPEAFQLYRTAARIKGITPVGLHAYDGHIRDKDLAERKQKCDAAYAPVEKLRADLQQEGLPEPVIIAGGSPTFPIHSKRAGVLCSPGTFIYWDKGYSDSCPEQPFEPAALVITRVISLPEAGKWCLDLGHKSIAAENELSRRVTFLNGPELQPIGQSEEHLVVEAGPDHTRQIGEVLYGLPMHICPTVALYERAITIENGRITGEWKNTARDRKISI